MDTEIGASLRPGGTVEPGNRAAVTRQVDQMPSEPARMRYELYDPFAEVTYRVSSFAQMVTRADQLGAVRFHAVREDGTRVPVVKVDGEWKRPDERLTQARARAAAPSMDREPSAASVGAKATTAATTAAPTKAVEAIDLDLERAERARLLQAGLLERYVVKRALVKVGDLSIGETQYRYRGDTNRVAFTESTYRLATDNNNPSVARSMVDVAEARNWRSLRISGHEDFRRLVWLEASIRGVKSLGYEPQLADQQLLRREREARAINRIEPLRNGATTAEERNASSPPTKQSTRGNGGRKAVLAALEAVLLSKGVPERQREAVMEAAAQNLARRTRAGEVHKVRVYDPAAPGPRTPAPPVREVQRAQERPSPTR